MARPPRPLALLAVPALLLLAAPASAQMAPRPFVMGDVTGRGHVGLESLFGHWEHDFLVNQEHSVWAGQLVVDTPVSPTLKIWGKVPFVHDRVDFEPGGDDSATALGNLTGGLRFLVGGSPETQLALGLSTSIPTAPDEGEGAGAAYSAALLYDLAEPGLYLPDVWTAGFDATFLFAPGNAFFGGELALRAYFQDDDVDGDDDQVNRVRLGLMGGAFLAPALAFIAELNSATQFGEAGHDEDDFYSALSLGLRLDTGGAVLGTRIYFPLDDEYRDIDLFGIGLDLLGTF